MKRRESFQKARAPHRAFRICFPAVAVAFFSLLVSSQVRAGDAAEFTWTVAKESALTNDNSSTPIVGVRTFVKEHAEEVTTKDRDAESISGRHLGSFAVGHSTRRLSVPGTLGENRPVNVHLWYPARSPDDCDSSGSSDGSGDDQGCSATPSMYTSRLYGIPLLPQWD